MAAKQWLQQSERDFIRMHAATMPIAQIAKSLGRERTGIYKFCKAQKISFERVPEGKPDTQAAELKRWHERRRLIKERADLLNQMNAPSRLTRQAGSLSTQEMIFQKYGV